MCSTVTYVERDARLSRVWFRRYGYGGEEAGWGRGQREGWMVCLQRNRVVQRKGFTEKTTGGRAERRGEMDGERENEWEEGEGVLVRKRLIKDLWENAGDLRVVSRLLAPRRWFRASGEEGRKRAGRPLSGWWAVGEEPAFGATLVVVRNNVISLWAPVAALRCMWFLATRLRRQQKKKRKKESKSGDFLSDVMFDGAWKVRLAVVR